MEKYTIYCTEAQTKKALELGAPLNTWGFARELVIPTAEQMIGWLEEQEPIKEVAVYRFPACGEFYWACDIFSKDGEYAVHCIGKYISRKEATLAAIDAALEYLIKNKK